MKLFIIFFAVLTGFPISVLAQAGKAASLIPRVSGYRFPRAADVKGQWSQTHWDGECRKAKEARKKAEGDAVEDIGGNETDEHRKANVEFACRQLVFPVHSAVGDYDGDGVQDEARIMISTKEPSYGHVVFFLKSKTARVRVVGTDSEFYPLRGHYIETIKPSGEKILTRCGMAESECDGPADLRSIVLKRDGLAIRAFEGHDVILYWDSQLGGFKSFDQ